MHIAKRLRPSLETLETRDCPAPLTVISDSYGNLTLMGTISPAGLSITADAPGVFTVMDGTNTVLAARPVPGNITVNIASPADDVVTIDLTAGGIFGSLAVNLGSGNDVVNLSGAGAGAGGVAGSVRLTGVNSINFFGTDIGGDFYAYNAADNLPGLLSLTDVSVGGALSYTGGLTNDNVFMGGVTVGRNATLNMSGGFNSGGLDNTNNINGSLSIIGGSDVDFFTVGARVGGSLTANLGNGLNTLSYDGFLEGGITYIGGSGDDNVFVGTGDTTVIGGSLYFNLGSVGLNRLDLGTFPTTVGGGSITYLGGVGVDSVTLDAGLDAVRTRVSMSLGAGDDIATVSTTLLAFLSIDFGAGSDTYVPPAAPYSFPEILRNL